MLKYTKDGLEKLVTEGSSVIKILEDAGWKLESDEPVTKKRKSKKQENETEEDGDYI
jgi:hypothetical protein